LRAGTSRRRYRSPADDEIGALGHAAQAFKDSMIEAERLRNAQKDAEEQADEARKVELARLGNEFQATVGNIVNAVSSASTELERPHARLMAMPRPRSSSRARPPWPRRRRPPMCNRSQLLPSR